MKAVGIRGALNASLGMAENKLTVIKIEIILTFSDRGPRLFQEDGKDVPLARSPPPPPPPPGRAHLGITSRIIVHLSLGLSAEVNYWGARAFSSHSPPTSRRVEKGAASNAAASGRSAQFP